MLASEFHAGTFKRFRHAHGVAEHTEVERRIALGFGLFPRRLILFSPANRQLLLRYLGIPR
jgi:hypothetical protein